MSKKRKRQSVLQERSYGSVKIISLNKEVLLTELQITARRLGSAHPKVQDVRIFGSIARGDQVGTSDVDVLVVLKDAGEDDWLERTRKFYRYFDLSVGVDLLVCTKDELARHLENKNSFWEQAWRESRSLLVD